jgi:uncharacterized membrane protein
MSILEDHILRVVKTKNPKTVAELVKILNQERTNSQQEIITRILKLQKQGKLNFQKNKIVTSKTLWAYLTSSNSHWYWVTIILTITATITVILMPENIYPLLYLRYALGSLLVLLFPGYTIIKLLFSTKELETITRIGLSVAISIPLVPIIGLLLNYTPLGISTTIVSLVILIVITIIATAAIIREYQYKAT